MSFLRLNAFLCFVPFEMAATMGPDNSPRIVFSNPVAVTFVLFFFGFFFFFFFVVLWI